MEPSAAGTTKMANHFPSKLLTIFIINSLNFWKDGSWEKTDISWFATSTLRTTR